LKKLTVLALCLLAISCTSDLNRPVETASSPASPAVPTSVQNAPTALITNTATPPPVPTLTSTATSIVPELAMTLTPFSNKSRIVQLYDMTICKFPCWWNITPGITSWEDAQSFLDFLGLHISTEITGDYAFHYVVLVPGDAYDKATISIYDKDSIVEYVAVRTLSSIIQHKSLYDPQSILETYGNPTRVKIYTEAAGQPIPAYGLELFYDTQGFMIEYSGDTQGITKSGILVCPNASVGINIYMQTKNNQNLIEGFPDQEFQVNQEMLQSYLRTLESATGLSIEDFRNLFLGNKPSYCFTVLN